MKKIILGITIGLLISTVAVYAAKSYLASDIIYKDTTVEAALNDLYQNNNDKFYIPKYTAPVHASNGGYSNIKINTEKYNKLIIDSRTRTGVVGTTYWQISGYENADGTGTATQLLNTTNASSVSEEFDITNYKMISLTVTCTAVGSGGAWHYYYFNGLTFLR